MSTPRKIDTTRIAIIRSNKNNDMLFLDDYFYHYEGRGEHTFRWVCAKRKAEDCRARVITTAVDGNKMKQEVVRLVGEHTHVRGLKHEIEKTLEHKRKEFDPEELVEEIEEESKLSESQPSVIVEQLRDVSSKAASNNASFEQKQRQSGTLAKPAATTETVTIKPLKTFKQNKVYLLKTNHGREMVCVNGFLYRLEGKSRTSATFRWECIRADVNCKARIYTERTNDEEEHKLRHFAESGGSHVHAHEAYTPRKLTKLVEKHKISFANEDDDDDDDDEFSENWEPPKKLKKVAVKHTSRQARRAAVIAKSILAKKKCLILPSAKGKRVLCVDNMIYHYDSRSTCNNRSYWTCILRRGRKRQCKARLVAEETSNGLKIVKMSGVHDHADYSGEIAHRLQKVDGKKESQDVKSVIVRKPKPDLLSADSSDSFASLSSDGSAHLPQRLEDMRENLNFELKSPERVDFIDSLDVNFYEQESHFDEQSQDPMETSQASVPQRQGRKRKASDAKTKREYKMNVNKITRLASAKGSFLLCVDGYIYQQKSKYRDRQYWVCIKRRDPEIKCESFITTINTNSDKIKVDHVTNAHCHPINVCDIQRRLRNELNPAKSLAKRAFMQNPLEESLDATLRKVSTKTRNAKSAGIGLKSLKSRQASKTTKMRKMKLYGVSDGPPSLAVRMTLKALKIPFELINVDYVAAEHMSESYAKMNPQKEIPVLDDNGFYLSESIAIMQYLCDKYAPDNDIYPKDATARALVNHRLCFNMGFYYASISMHAMAPIFFDYPRDEMSVKKVNNALAVFETYLQRGGTKYAAAEHVTLADFALVAATICLEAINFDLSPYPLVKNWYETFKQENPELWEVANGGMQEIAAFEKNPPDLSHMNHPFHPTRKPKV